MPKLILWTAPTLACVATCAVLLSPAALAEPPSAPLFALPTGEGAVDLARLKGRVVYLDFWASWCGPCRKSFPWMNAMQAKYAGQGLTVIAVNLDQDKALAAKFLAEHPATFTVAYDPKGQTAERYGVKGMPSSYLVDREGRLQMTHLGFRDQDREALEAELRKLLGTAVAGAAP